MYVIRGLRHPGSASIGNNRAPVSGLAELFPQQEIRGAEKGWSDFFKNLIPTCKTFVS
jgi:hypothetical protein